MNKSLTVSELTGYIKQLVDNDMLLSYVWVTGEISNFKAHSSGHMYFSLKDEKSVIRCVMFRSHNFRLKFRPEEGMRVIVRGYVSVYPQGGNYQLYIEEMQPDGTGALYLAFEQLKNRLEQQGYFDPAKKKPIPLLPCAIGVITSPTGAVIRDIINVLTRRYSNCRIVVYGSAVQGDEAACEMIKGINLFNRLKNVDVIILARGGGSLEDLWPFNDEKLAKAIVGSDIPIISAVGHETDFTISDFAADLRAPTPSAAAELVMPEKRAMKDNLKVLYKRLNASLINRLNHEKNKLQRLSESRSLTRPLEQVNLKRQYLDMMERNLLDRGKYKMENLRSSLRLLAGKLDALSPLTVLSRGYSVTQNKSGDMIRSVKQLKSGEELLITVCDGKFQVVYDKTLTE
ncbi:MAG: exodeoxyribonuclease VII large subunit [Clostridiaceae bacterium]|nr:exodeoxyribonuclease VII large subunit [Clostridiaceae bacterium]